MARAIQAKVWNPRKTVAHARALLGKYLVRRRADGSVAAYRITEVEAYNGERDLASHAAKGRTRRTEVLYGPAGRWYIYLCYGIHEMLNLVVGPPGWPAGILIRGIEGFSGPGVLTRALGIDRRLNGAVAARPSGLWLEDRGELIPRSRIHATARIGVDYAGPVWSQKRWRFTLAPAVRAPAGSAAGSRSKSRRRSQS
jgi:DNA-3-methyladenine glycosylase